VIARLLILAASFLLPSLVRADLPDTIARVKQSMVVVGTYARLRSPQFAMHGSGFAIGNGTLVATNAHVVPEGNLSNDTQGILMVLASDGIEPRQRGAKLLVRDVTHDLAILRIDGPALPALSLHAGDTIREGQAVAFTGFPIGGVLGFSPVTHRGIIASITPIAQPGGNAGDLRDTAIRRLRKGAFPIYQLDATAYPGNSGGPLFDPDTGEVLGILNMVFVKGSKEAVLEKPSGISYAIPVGHLVDLLKNVRP
jgi:S1-C subfamily serine protease